MYKRAHQTTRFNCIFSPKISFFLFSAKSKRTRNFVCFDILSTDQMEDSLLFGGIKLKIIKLRRDCEKKLVDQSQKNL